MPAAKNERMNLRCSAGTLATLREAAEIQGQDLTSFVLGAALDKARSVVAEDRILRLEPTEVMQLERMLDAEPAVIPHWHGSSAACAHVLMPHADSRPRLSSSGS